MSRTLLTHVMLRQLNRLLHVAANSVPVRPTQVSSCPSDNSAGRQLARAYKATEHGWGALQFHKRCDMKGPCVIYCETDQGDRFGGFNSEGFKSSDDYSASSKAFLFCWVASDKEPVVLRKVQDCDYL